MAHSIKEEWFKGFRCHGNPDQILDFIISTVQTENLRKYNLSKFVQTAYFEKHSQNQGGEFYLFLGFNSPVRGSVPKEVCDILFQFSIFNSPLQKPFYTEQEIRRMCTPKENLDGWIPYWKPITPPETGPFEGERDNSYLTDADEEISQNYDRLLLWLSAVGSGSWDTLRGALQALKLEGNGTTSAGIFRRMRLLGHLESSLDGRRWSVAPSVLTRLEKLEAANTYVLCGQRDETLLETLRSFATVTFASQIECNAPATVLVQLEDTESISTHLAELASDHRMVYVTENAGFQLACALPPYQDWQSSLQAVSGVLPDNFTLRRFNGTIFVETIFQQHNGLYEFWLKEDRHGHVSLPEFTLLFDTATMCWRRGDWYGLRFLSRLMANERCPVYYDSASYSLALPCDWRWPEIYERALTLASGKLPLLHDGWLRYEGISPRILEALEHKLGLERKDADIA